jgi:hypothetical protein
MKQQTTFDKINTGSIFFTTNNHQIETDYTFEKISGDVKYGADGWAKNLNYQDRSPNYFHGYETVWVK